MINYVDTLGSSELLLHKLPRVRGRYSVNISLSTTVWFRVGGPAQVVFKPADVQDLVFFLKEKPSDIPVTVIGVGSNLLVRDGGVPGVVVRLGKGFNNIALRDGVIDVGAAVLDRNVALLSQEESVSGLEFLCGIPGTIGGALRMNAGCYGKEIKDVLDVAFAVDGNGKIHKLTADDMGFSYRSCAIPDDWIFIGARLKAACGDGIAVKESIDMMLKEREKTQPVNSRTGGSTFANPEGLSAWKLIDKAGCRGLRVGGAQMSELHCNFMINTGDATAADLELLAETVRYRVLQNSSIDLRWEIKRIGVSDVSSDSKKVA
jgi:UDP-N-acetylmuramate dehydrogenase